MTEEQMIRLEHYLDGSLSEAEKADLEAELAQKPELKIQIEKLRSARQVLETLASWEWKAKLQNLQPGGRSRIRPFWSYSSIAAAIVILVGVLGWLWMGKTNSSPVQFADLYEVYPAPSLRGERKLSADFWSEGVNAYLQGDLALAAQKLSLVAPESTRYMEASFYYGVASLGAEKANEAIAPLQRVLAAEDPRFSQAAGWYLFLAYWQAGDEFKAEQTVRLILEDSAHPYHAKAKAWQESQRK
jgi:hypothetical protein